MERVQTLLTIKHFGPKRLPNKRYVGEEGASTGLDPYSPRTSSPQGPCARLELPPNSFGKSD